MRSTPDMNDKWDKKDLEKLNAEEWMLDLLKLNPSYVFWGPYEDYMCDEKGGWAAPLFNEGWDEHIELDELNEIVNFYFEVERDSHECPHCKGNNLNKETHRIYEDFYDFARTGRRWVDKITQDEVVALVKAGRLGDFMDKSYRYDEKTDTWSYYDRSLGEKVTCGEPEYPSAREVNDAQNKKGKGFLGHDAINHWTLTETRARRLGVWGDCEHCVEGRIYDEDVAHVNLITWLLHPRKGCSRGVEYKRIKQEDLPSIFKYLKEANDRNMARFSKVTELALATQETI